MTYIRQQRGFTLIEVVVVLGISALLLTTFLSGRGVQREQSRFSTTVDSAVGFLVDQQNQAQTSLQSGAANNRARYGTSDVAVFGQLVEFNPATPSKLTAWTLVIRDDGVGGLVQCDKVDYNMPNGVVYNGKVINPATGLGDGTSRAEVIFTKLPAQLYIVLAPPKNFNAVVPSPPLNCQPPLAAGLFVPSVLVFSADNRILNAANYTPTNASFAPAAPPLLAFTQAGTNRRASIKANPADNTINRKFY